MFESRCRTHRNGQRPMGAWLDCVTIVRIMAKLRPFTTDCFNLTKLGRIFASFNVLPGVIAAARTRYMGKKGLNKPNLFDNC